MIVNPYKGTDATAVIPPTRLLVNQQDMIGVEFVDPKNPNWIWTVIALLAPIPGRTLPGVRLWVQDHRVGIYSCYGQRDAEVALGYYNEGDIVPWMSGTHRYVSPGDPNFYGACMDVEDLRDDLLLRERMVRSELFRQTGSYRIPPGSTLKRKIHMDYQQVIEETLICYADPLTTQGTPGTDLDGVTTRWRRNAATLVTGR